MGYFDSVYAKLPVWAQHGAISLYGGYWYWVRFGPGFGRYLREFTAREQWTLEQWQDWQQQAVRRLLQMAAAYVPYYSRTWNATELAAARAGRLSELPLLDKDPLRADPEAFLRSDFRPWRRLVVHTSGSTGTPIKRICTSSEVRQALALREIRSARWAGVSFAMPRATFSGRLVEPNPRSRGPFHRFNLVERQVYFSAFHLRPDTAQSYVEALYKHKVQWMTGYAVSYYLLAQLILEQKLTVPELKAVITTSEKLTPEMRRVITAAFRCRVFEEYSTVENVLFAGACEHGQLHVSPDAGVVEILRPDGTHCAPDEVGEVVATGLLDDYQPLIRYRLGDLAKWATAPCPCGRRLPVIQEVLGRIEDVVIGPDGRRLVRFHGIFVNQPHVREGQIIQESLHRICVKVVPVNGFGPDDQQDIVQRVQQRLGAQVEVVVEPVEMIPRTRAGKFKAVVSLLSQARDTPATLVVRDEP